MGSVIMEFFEKLWNTMLENQYILWSVVACLAALLVLLVLLIVVSATKKRAKNKTLEEAPVVEITDGLLDVHTNCVLCGPSFGKVIFLVEIT